jgi:hypothetical protein
VITHEKIGKAHVVTILDDAGNDADLELHFEDGASTIAIRQNNPDTGEGDVLVITPMQGIYLREILKDMLHLVERSVH